MGLVNVFVNKSHVWSVWLNLSGTIELKMSFIVIGPVARKNGLLLLYAQNKSAYYSAHVFVLRIRMELLKAEK